MSFSLETGRIASQYARPRRLVSALRGKKALTCTLLPRRSGRAAPPPLTEDGPAGEAIAIAVGVFVGCTPFYGLHRPICRGLAALARLDPRVVAQGATVSNPLVAPLLVLAELAVGALARTGSPKLPIRVPLRELEARSLGLDLAVGCLVAGSVLAVAALILTYGLGRVGARDPAFDRLVRRASRRYLGASFVGWQFARAKPRVDPVYRAVLFGDLLPRGGTLLDVGCGQGLMLALLIEAEAAREGPGPAPPPAVQTRRVGVETRPGVARLARSAVSPEAEIVEADARRLELEPCSAVLLFDVLQMMSKPAQLDLLETIRRMLLPSGVLLVREADAGAGRRFLMVRFANRLKAICIGAFGQELRFRSRDEWLACFRSLGFHAEICRVEGGDPLGNVLFRLSGA
jgi:uncharacterized protein (DUF2062 family)